MTGSPLRMQRPQSPHWQHYAIEAWGLGMLMIVAGGTAMLFHFAPFHAALEAHPLGERFCFGLVMGLTAMSIVYSPWGARSGAHFNPALTLTFAVLGKIAPRDAVGYIAAQFLGGVLGLSLLASVGGDALREPPVHAIVTLPGMHGPIVAFVAEWSIAFLLMSVVLNVSNGSRPRLTGVAAACCVVLFITFEAPLSGMSLNPARTSASAFVAHEGTALWIYFSAPLFGMLSAAALFVAVRGRRAVRCARLYHTFNVACIFRCGYTEAELETVDERHVEMDRSANGHGLKDLP